MAIEVFCDGGSRNNPGHAAYGYVVRNGGEIVKEGNGYIGIATNNVAEYTAIIEALKWLQKNYKGKDILFNLDSNLAVSQLSGIYRVKNAAIRDLVFKIKTLEPSFKSIAYRHIPRELNKHADRLVNIALDEQLEH